MFAFLWLLVRSVRRTGLRPGFFPWLFRGSRSWSSWSFRCPGTRWRPFGFFTDISWRVFMWWPRTWTLFMGPFRALWAFWFWWWGFCSSTATAARWARGSTVSPFPLLSRWCTLLLFLLIFGPRIRFFLVFFVPFSFSFQFFFFFPLKQLVSIVFNLFLKTLAWFLGSFPRL